jgi:hypothetical protein
MAARKNKAWWALPFSALLTLNAYADEAIALKLKNQLAACIKISKPTMYSADGILFAKITYVRSAPITACGCKSAVSNYAAFSGKKGRNAFLMSGDLLFDKADTMNLPLTLDPNLIVDKAIKLNFLCGYST